MTILGNSQARAQLELCLHPESKTRTILLTGPDYVGKRSFAEELLKTKIHEQDLIVPEASVDGIRELVRLSIQPTASSSFTAGFVDGVDKLSDSAQDGLLKICEEPPAGFKMILIAADEGHIPMALHSRCHQIIRWHLLSDDEMTAFGESVGCQDPVNLRLCRGRPGLYNAIATGPSLIAVRESITRIREYDFLTAPTPEAVKGVGSGSSPARDALSLTIRYAAIDLMNQSDPSGLAFLRLSSNLQKHPAINAELHWRRALLESSL